MTTSHTGHRAGFTSRIRTVAGFALAAFAAVVLTACGIAPLPSLPDVPGRDDRPIPVDGVPPSTGCLELFPAAGTVPDLAHYSAVPENWAQPAGVELCVAIQADDVATLHYATALTPEGLVDEWEPLLAEYDVIRDTGLAELPVLYATNRTTAAIIQALGDGTALVSIQKIG